MRLARRIEAGQVSINTLWSGGVIGAPFGGYKSSGFGRTVSAESILDYTQVKSVIIDGRAVAVDVSLEGKVALVTGAGPNIGSGIALALSRYGARVACNDVDGDAADASACPDRAPRRRRRWPSSGT